MSRLTYRLLLSAALLLPAPLAAQQVAQAGEAALDVRSAAGVRAHYLADLDTLHAKIVALAQAIPAERYDWRPGPGVRSVSEVLMHVAGEWYYYVPMSVAGKAPADFGMPREKLPALEKITTKGEVLAQLDSAWSHCRAQVSGADPASLTTRYKPWGISLDEAAFAMSGDLHEHLGQLIAYSRQLGVRPPWSKQ